MKGWRVLYTLLIGGNFGPTEIRVLRLALRHHLESGHPQAALTINDDILSPQTAAHSDRHVICHHNEI